MADNSIERYKKALEQYQGTQQSLTDMGLSPEPTENPVADMIDQAIAEEKDASKMATLRKLQVKNDEDELSDTNLDADQKADIEATIRDSRESLTGLPSAQNLEKRAKLTETGTAGTNVFEGAAEKPELPPVAAPDADLGLSRSEILNRYRTAVKPSADVAAEPVLSALEQAKADRRQQEAFADISEGISKFAAAYAGGGVYDIKPDISGAQRMRKAAQRGVVEAEKEAKLQSAQKKAESDAMRKKKLDDLNQRYKLAQIQKLQKEEVGGKLSKDPTSDESKAAQEQTMNMMGSMGIKYDPEKIGKLNAETLGSKQFTASLRKSVNNLSEKRHQATETERFNKWTEKKEDDLVKSIDKFNKDKEVVRANSMISGSKIARDMVESGNPIAAASIPNFLARASGEVGALTEADKEPFGGSRAIITRSSQIAKQMADGTLTEANKRYVLELADVYEKTANRVKTSRADEFSGQLGGIDFPVEMLRNRYMGTDRTAMPEQVLPKTPAMLTGRDKEAYDWAKANESDPRAKQILKKLGL